MSYFFGNRTNTEDDIKSKLKIPKIVFLKQTHSDIIHKVNALTPSHELVGDALITHEFDVGIGVYSADCLPTLVFAENEVAAIHTGWRGIQNRLIFKTLIELKSKIQSIYIGPHIQMSSFEVDVDVAEKLATSTKNSKDNVFQKPDSNKYLVNLSGLALAQIKEAVSYPVSIEISSINTKTNNLYFSYRREKSGGRNLAVLTRSK